MDRYWPLSKVYFLGQLALFPERLTNRELSPYDLGDNATTVLQTLQSYVSEGLFQLEIRFSPSYIKQEEALIKMSAAVTLIGNSSTGYKLREKYGLGPAYESVKGNHPLTEAELKHLLGHLHKECDTYLRFKIIALDQTKVQVRLIEYLNKFHAGDLTSGGAEDEPESYEIQFMHLFNALNRQYESFLHKPVVKLTDIWLDKFKRSPAKARFWELLFLAHFSNSIRLINIGYEGRYQSSKYTGAKAYTYEHPTPFAKLEILEPLRQNIPYQPQQAQSTPPAATGQTPLLVLSADSEDRRLVLKIGDAYKLISKRRCIYKSNPHKLPQCMVANKGHEVARDRAGLPGNLKISNLVQELGFTGIVHSKLLAGCGAETVTLKEDALLNPTEADEIRKSCQDRFDFIQFNPN